MKNSVFSTLRIRPGRSNCCCILNICSFDAWSPNNNLTGSPGIKCVTKNEITVTTSKTGIIFKTLLPIYLIIETTYLSYQLNFYLLAFDYNTYQFYNFPPSMSNWSYLYIDLFIYIFNIKRIKYLVALDSNSEYFI